MSKSHLRSNFNWNSFGINHLCFNRRVGSAAVSSDPQTYATISGLQGWYDASRMPVVSDATAITQFTDWSGNTRHGDQPTSDRKPTYKLSRFNGIYGAQPALRFDGTDYYTITGYSGPGGTGFTAICVCRGTAMDSMIRFQNGVSYVVPWRAQSGNNLSAISVDGGTGGVATGAILNNAPQVLALRWESGRVLGYNTRRSGVAMASRNAAVSTLVSTDSFIGAAAAGTPAELFIGDMACVGWYNRYLSDAELVSLTGYLADKYLPRIIWDGNSHIASSPISLNAHTTIFGFGTVYYANYAVSAQTTQMMIDDFATQVAPNIVPGTIVVAWEATNSIVFGASAATALNELITYYNLVKAKGGRFITGTIMPRSFAGTPEEYEDSRVEFNTLLRAAAGVAYDALADIAAEPLLGAPNAELNTTYFNTDKVHLVTAGNTLATAIFVTAMMTLI